MKARQALITGGTSGVGRQLVLGAAREGYDVTFLGRDRARGEQLQRALRAAYPSRSSHFVYLDLESLGKVQRFAEAYRTGGGELHLLANIAGSLVAESAEADQTMDRSLVVSCLAALQLTQELLPSMKQVRGARIINVGASPGVVLRARIDLQRLEQAGQLAMAGARPRGYSPFVASALAVHAKVVLTHCLAEQLKGALVTVNAFHPGAIRSGLFRGLSGPRRWALLAAQPFLSRECAAAHRAAFDPDLSQTSGTLLVGKDAISLEFESEYRQRLWEIAQRLLKRSLV